MALVSVDKVAKALNTGVRSVQRLVLEGMPRAERGKYDLAQCMLWYIRYLQKIVESRGLSTEDAVGASLRQERQRLIKAQADREELELSARRAELMPVALYGERIAAFTMTVRQRLLMLPARVAPQLEGENRVVIKAKLEQAVRGTLAALSEELINGDGHKTGVAGPHSRTGEAGGASGSAPADAQNQRVGRAESHPA